MAKFNFVPDRDTERAFNFVPDKHSSPQPQATDKPFYNDAYEVGRQVAAGAAVDLPRMVGQGLRWAGADETGRAIVENADSRAGGWEPDEIGRGAVASTLIKGGRAIAPMTPAIAATFVNPALGATVAASQFGMSSAQDTEDKLRLQGVSDKDATEAGWRTGMIQGPLEGAATYATGGLWRAGKAAYGARPGMGTVLERMTDTAVLKPMAKSFGLNMLVQPATEVAQDLGTEFNERSYGAKPEDAWGIAKDSAQGAIGMTALLGPFSFLAHRSGAKRAEQLKTVLEAPDAPMELKQQAWDVVSKEADRAGVDKKEIADWLRASQEDARLNAEGSRLKAAPADLLNDHPKFELELTNPDGSETSPALAGMVPKWSEGGPLDGGFQGQGGWTREMSATNEQEPGAGPAPIHPDYSPDLFSQANPDMREVHPAVAAAQAQQAATAQQEQQAQAQQQSERSAAFSKLQLDEKNKDHVKVFDALQEAAIKGAMPEDKVAELAAAARSGVPASTIINTAVKPAVAAVEKAQKAAETSRLSLESTKKSAVAEQAHGFISAEGMETVLAAPTPEHAKAALVAARKAEIARKAEAKKAAADAAKEAAAVAAMAQTTPNKPYVVPTPIIATAPATDTAAAPKSETTAAAPKTAPVSGATGTDAVQEQPTAAAAPAVQPVKPASEAVQRLKKQAAVITKIAGRKAVLGNSVDFSALKQVVEPIDARLHNAIRLVLGIDKDGDRIQPLTVQAAAEKTGLTTPGKKESGDISRAMSALGITPDVKKRFWNSPDARSETTAEGDIWAEGAEENAPEADVAEDYVEKDERPLTAEEAASSDYDSTAEDVKSETKLDGRTAASAGGSKTNVGGIARSAIETDRMFPAVVRGFRQEDGTLDLSAATNTQIGMLGALALKYAGNPASDALIGKVNAEATKRLTDLDRGVATTNGKEIRAGMVDGIKVLERQLQKEEEANEKRAQAQIDAKRGQSSEVIPAAEGNTGRGASGPAEDQTDNGPTPVKFSKNAQVGQAAQTTVTITGPDGNQLVLENPGKALEVQGKKIDKLKALLKCLTAG